MVFRSEELLRYFSWPKLSFCPSLSVQDICLRGQAFSVCMMSASLCLPSQDLFISLFVVCLSVCLSIHEVVIGHLPHRSGVYYYARLAVNTLEIICVFFPACRLCAWSPTSLAAVLFVSVPFLSPGLGCSYICFGTIFNCLATPHSL